MQKVEFQTLTTKLQTAHDTRQDLWHVEHRFPLQSHSQCATNPTNLSWNLTKTIFKIKVEYFQFQSAEFVHASNPFIQCSVTNLKVLAGGFDRALVHTFVLHRVLAVGFFFQVQWEGWWRLPPLWFAASLSVGFGCGPAAGGHPRCQFGILRRPSLSCEGAQIDLHSH